MAEEKKALIIRDMLVKEIISRYPDVVFALMQCDIGYIGYPVSQAESLQDTSMVHSMSADEVVDYVNGYLQFQASQKKGGKIE